MDGKIKAVLFALGAIGFGNFDRAQFFAAQLPADLAFGVSLQYSLYQFAVGV